MKTLKDAHANSALYRTLHQSITLPFNLQQLLFSGFASLCLTPWITAPLALMLGMTTALTIENPFPQTSKWIARSLLQVCVVMLGFGMDLTIVLKAGQTGVLFAVFTIGTTLLLGQGLGRRLKIPKKASILISVGTAICGGSAIAAVSSVIGAAEQEISIAMGTIFLLNAVALYVFPVFGHLLHLTSDQFGTWAGVAIHDISSVVGAASHYGTDALNIATAVKLSRALWIVPVSLLFAFLFRTHPTRQLTAHRIQVPWFIGFFLLASVIRTLFPVIAAGALPITTVSEIGLKLTLFLIGAGLSAQTLRSVGWQPILQGIILWIAISMTSLSVIVWTIH